VRFVVSDVGHGRLALFMVITTALVQPLQLTNCGQAFLQATADTSRSNDHVLQQDVFNSAQVI
jgi:hypothetical protein